jgi:hypothetical protein
LIKIEIAKGVSDYDKLCFKLKLFWLILYVYVEKTLDWNRR